MTLSSKQKKLVEDLIEGGYSDCVRHSESYLSRSIPYYLRKFGNAFYRVEPALRALGLDVPKYWVMLRRKDDSENMGDIMAERDLWNRHGIESF